MKKLTIATVTLLLFVFTGCNTVAPSDRVDRTELTKNLNFKQIKFKFVSAIYSQKSEEQQIYWQWLQKNKERVNPFLDLRKWREKVVKQHQKDEKAIVKIR